MPALAIYKESRNLAGASGRQVCRSILRLHGCLYGQKLDSKQFYCTLSTWLCDNIFVKAEDEPCLFVNSAGVRVLLWVDDLLVRGLRADTDTFYDTLKARFECMDGARQ